MGWQIIPVQDVIMESLELRKKLLGTMAQISFDMREEILTNHYDKASSDEKYLLGMYEDAYKTSHMVCESIKELALTQGGALLRKLIEQVCIVTILTNRKEELLSKYVEHYKLRKEIWSKEKHEQVTIVAQKFNIPEGPGVLQYMDYGWISRNAKEKNLYYEAGFEDLVAWKDTFLDKFVHSSYINMDLVGNNYDFPIIHNLIDILTKVFDYLCTAFHKLTGFEFIFEGKDMFQGEFRKLYKEFLEQNNY